MQQALSINDNTNSCTNSTAQEPKLTRWERFILFVLNAWCPLEESLDERVCGVR